MSKRKSNAISCPNCGREFPSDRSISSHLQTCQTIQEGWNPSAPREQIIAQEFEDIQADQTEESINTTEECLQDTDILNAITNRTGHHEYSFNRVCLPR